MATLTAGAANGQPLVGPVVINEIMYSPASGGTEFIELFNRSAQAVPLFDPANPSAAWRFTAGVEFIFPPADGSNAQYPAGITLAAGERLLVVEGDPEEAFARPRPARVAEDFRIVRQFEQRRRATGIVEADAAYRRFRLVKSSLIGLDYWT
jgi:hypothetical protein